MSFVPCEICKTLIFFTISYNCCEMHEQTMEVLISSNNAWQNIQQVNKGCVYNKHIIDKRSPIRLNWCLVKHSKWSRIFSMVKLQFADLDSLTNTKCVAWLFWRQYFITFNNGLKNAVICFHIFFLHKNLLKHIAFWEQK